MLLRRATPLLVLVALLAAPAAALAHSPDSSASKKDKKGSLSITDGKGKVDLRATGAVIGKVSKGKVKIKIFKGKHTRGTGSHGKVVIRMRGKGTITRKPDGVTVYKGKNINIYIVDKKFRVRINGVGINLSSAGQGTCKLQASPTASDPGTFQLNDGDSQPLPQTQTTYQLGSS